MSSHRGTARDVIGLLPPGRLDDDSCAVCLLAVSAMAASVWAGSETHIKGTFGAFWLETVSIMQAHPYCGCLNVFECLNLPSKQYGVMKALLADTVEKFKQDFILTVSRAIYTPDFGHLSVHCSLWHKMKCRSECLNMSVSDLKLLACQVYIA